MKKPFVVFALAGAMSLSVGFALAVDQERVQTQEQEQIYGSQFMTQQERDEYRAKIQAAKTTEEREQIRNEHHERVKELTKTRGVTLPSEPPVRGGSMGLGGMGAGGGGRVSGGGRGR